MKLFIFLAFIVATMAKLHQSERLLDQAIDQLEHELAAKGEENIYFQNDLDEVLYVNWSCDRMSLMTQESTWSAGLNVALEKVEVGGTLSNTEKKEWTYQYIDRTLAFVKIQPGSFLEESTGLNCENVFVDVWTVRSNGEINKFMIRSGVDKGEIVIVSGTADAPVVDKTYEVCGGDKCGCEQNKCWKTCMGISKCNTKWANQEQTIDYYQRYSPEYKRWWDNADGNSYEDKIESDTVGWVGVFNNGPKMVTPDGKPFCTMDRQCKPSFKCSGSCTLWGG